MTQFEPSFALAEMLLDWILSRLLVVCSVSQGKSTCATLMNDTVVLHLNGPESPYWSIDKRSISLFQLPSLQRLTLSCVNIEDDLVVKARSFTSLKHLTLEESNITHKGLICILSLPKALESLYLGQPSHHHINQTLD